jgi:hypothetical protein
MRTAAALHAGCHAPGFLKDVITRMRIAFWSSGTEDLTCVKDGS